MKKCVWCAREATSRLPGPEVKQSGSEATRLDMRPQGHKATRRKAARLLGFTGRKTPRTPPILSSHLPTVTNHPRQGWRQYFHQHHPYNIGQCSAASLQFPPPFFLPSCFSNDYRVAPVPILTPKTSTTAHDPKTDTAEKSTITTIRLAHQLSSTILLQARLPKKPTETCSRVRLSFHKIPT